MCLQVKTTKKILVQKVIKLLKVDNNGEAYTPYIGASINSNGLLVAQHSNRIIGDRVNGEGVHSILSKTSHWRYANRDCDLVPAYAICVFAQGDRKDVVSKALYIPRLDKTKKKNDNRKIAALNKAKSVKDIIKIFPELKDVL